jgi:hypothetical protein
MYLPSAPDEERRMVGMAQRHILAAITPTTIVQLAAWIGFVSATWTLLTVDRDIMLVAWTYTVGMKPTGPPIVRMPYLAWLLTHKVAIVGWIVILMVTLQYAIVASRFGLKLIRMGREMRRKSHGN